MPSLDLTPEGREKLINVARDLVTVCKKHGLTSINATVYSSDDLDGVDKPHEYIIEWGTGIENPDDVNGVYGGALITAVSPGFRLNLKTPAAE